MPKIYLKIVFLSLISIFSLSIIPSFAQSTSTATTTPPVDPTVSQPVELPSPRSLNPETENIPESLNKLTTIEALKNKGRALVKVRLEALERLNNRIGKSKLTTEQKIKLQSDIAKNVTDLKEVLVKIEAGTDPVMVRNLVKSIYTDFRIFAVAIPRLSGLMHAWLSLDQVARVSESLAKVEIKIAELKTKGVTTTKMEALVSETKTKLGTAKLKFETAATLLEALKPVDYPGSKDTLRRVREMLKNGQKEIRKAQQVIHKLNRLLRERYLLDKLEAQRLRLKEQQLKRLQKLEERRHKILEQTEKQKERVEAQSQKLQEKLEKKLDRLNDDDND